MSTNTNANDRDPKELNNDWSATSTLWVAGFEVEVATEGNEARGEGPHVSADYAVQDHLRSLELAKSEKEEPLPKWQPEREDARRSAEFATDGVDMTVSMVADGSQVADAFAYQDRFDTAEDVVSELFPGVRKAVEESLPDEWAQLEELSEQ